MHDDTKRQIITYQLSLMGDAIDRQFSDEEKILLRPIAETLAMLDGNAFFGMDTGDGREWYEQYLPEAWSLFHGSGGIRGWAGGMEHVKRLANDHPSVVEARRSLEVALALSNE